MAEGEQWSATFEGTWCRLHCEQCGNWFEVEDDVSNGEEVECESCGTMLIVVGR